MSLILVTNDDGIHSLGLKLLVRALEKVGDVVVAAPTRQKSGISHAITLGQPLRVKKLEPNQYAVSGTPADAVFLGIFELCDRKPDLVVSGINHGANVGTFVFYSGTVAAAIEAGIRGIPSIAVSQQLPDSFLSPSAKGRPSPKEDGWDAFERTDDKMTEYLKQTANFTVPLARALLEQPLPKGMVLNVNGPNQITDKYCWARLGTLLYRGTVERRLDPRGMPYYWLGNPQFDIPEETGTDLDAMNKGMFSLTPLFLDWTGDLANVPKWDLEGFHKSR
ncbi:MAG: 5'/3'-nucleotidase SurE [Pseudomonadota bacterium]